MKFIERHELGGLPIVEVYWSDRLGKKVFIRYLWGYHDFGKMNYDVVYEDENGDMLSREEIEIFLEEARESEIKERKRKLR